MLLKDKLKKVFKNTKEPKDKIKLPMMDGFVDIKGYKDGKLFYHDCGDNVVTDWMRQAIMLMLSGVTFTSHGDSPYFEEVQEGQQKKVNYDGYVFNGKQYDAVINEDDQKKFSISLNGKDKALFPTKILFGTGKEYSSWNILKTENETTHPVWFEEMTNLFGGEGQAATNFDKCINSKPEEVTYAYSNINTDYYNNFSGTIAPGVHSGDGLLAKCRTVNDPDTSTTEVASAVSMYRNYGVIGAIKTPYQRNEGGNYPDMLQNVTSESGKLLLPKYRGVGQPAFIYFNQHSAPESDEDTENWADPSAEVCISKDPADKYLTKITFTITLPEQSTATSSVGAYYPYNGFTLKQIGLYNDSQIVLNPTGEQQTPGSSDGAYYPYSNMIHGMLLAVKNIAPFTKQAGSNYVISWTITI